MFAQFACTSLWFAGNAVLPDLLREVRFEGTSLGAVVSAVQLGFIVGTLLLVLPRPAFGAVVLVWSMAVVADSPQFSAVVAQRAPAAATGTALTLVACLGFALTTVSLQAFGALQGQVEACYLFLLLMPGPVLGLLATRPTRVARTPVSSE